MTAVEAMPRVLLSVLLLLSLSCQCTVSATASALHMRMARASASAAAVPAGMDDMNRGEDSFTDKGEVAGEVAGAALSGSLSAIATSESTPTFDAKAGTPFYFLFTRGYTGQTIPANSDTIVTMTADQTNYNWGNGSRSNLSKFSPPIPGIYQISYSVTFNAGGNNANGGTRAAYVALNGNTLTRYGYCEAAPNSYGGTTCTSSVALRLQTTDYANLWVYQNAHSGIVTVSQSASGFYDTTFSIYYVGGYSL